MFGFPNYPRGNTDIINLDYILNELKSQGEKIESWIQFSQIKFADPIDWDINTTYKAYTIVLAPDFNSYISKRDVSGHAYIDYTNTDFWYKIGNYNAQVEAVDKKIDSNISRTSEMKHQLDGIRGQICANLINPTAPTQTVNGVTFTNNGDGTYTVNGTASVWTFLNINLINGSTLSIPVGTHKLTGTPSNNGGVRIQIMSPTAELGADIGNGSIFTVPQGTTGSWARIAIDRGTTCNNLLFKPMITTDLNATYDDFVPYTGDSGRLNEDVANLNRVVKNRRRIIAIGDSYGADNGSYWTGWVNCLKNIDKYDEVYGAGVGGAGFVNKSEGSNFLDILKSIDTGVANNSITDIIVMGGYNDASVSANQNAIYNAMKEFVSYANNKYPNAKLHLGFIAFNRFDSATQMRLDTYMGIYQQYGILAGFTFYRNLYFVLKRTSFVFNVSGNPNSGFHPNTDGNNEVALQALNCIRNGECHVHYGAVELGMNIYMDDGMYSFETTGEDSWGSQYMNNVAMPFNTPVECVDAKNLELVWALQTATPFYLNALLVDNTLKILTNVRVAFANGKISYSNVGNTETVTPNNTMQFWFNKTNGVSWQNMF